MSHLRKLGVVVPVLLAAVAVAGVTQANGPFWNDNPDPAALSATGSRRPRLVYFTAPWCGPCRLLEREVFVHPDGRAELNHYELIRFDLEHPAGREAADSLRVETVPTFVILDSLGVEIERVRGYRSRRRLLGDLERFRHGRGTLAALERALALAPGNPSLQAAVGLRLNERLDLAALPLLAASLTDPAALDDTLAAAAGRALANAQFRQGDTTKAARTLNHLLALRPHHLYPRATWRQLAAYRQELGESQKAVDAWWGAALVAPTQVDDMIRFARAAAAAGWRLEEAERLARRAVTQTRRADPTAAAALAAVLRRQRRYPEALVWIKRAVAMAPTDTAWSVQRDQTMEAAIAGE